MNNQHPLPLLPVQPEFDTWRGHRIATYRAGHGQPMLLVHSINAAASAFEMRGPFNQLQSDYTMHAFDLLGYGNSDRPARVYQAEDYIDQTVAQLERIGAPTVLIASSLGAAYAIAAAARVPDLVSALVLACPVGISQLATPPSAFNWSLYRLLDGPLGRWVFRQLTSKRSMRFFLARQAYNDPASFTPETLTGFYTPAQIPGSHYAPVCFVSGLLTCDIAAVYPRLRMPIQIIWGRQATTTPVSKANEFVQMNPRARLEVIDRASMLVQDERPAEFARLVRAFLANVG
ncbi:alpha/beta hydrolase fold-containing protein [Oscillochloris trichoides DG-6]|uniref:Alpha/beta hydrolase fold-containing protein n=1 Tax=Oscillochloris trichoides DG-6 TaxID=765420 RepID=E1IIE1_9CHLR|nr:alpha/beta hydrolase [Oscillochloris trichoides]EFO79016.1 alpha/beta hydrolase fold-containing protein [Oscillochloris trichoides DG-6]